MKSLIFVSCTLIFLCSCGSNEVKQEAVVQDSSITKPLFDISSTSFGSTQDGRVTAYTLSNPQHMQVTILNYGGIITRILVPDRQGNMGDVVLGYDSLAGYRQAGNPYFGATIGRYGNRIAHAQFSLQGKQYKLAANNGPNTLHGGIKGFDKVMWKSTPMPGDTSCSLKLEYKSPDGEEGFPGNLQCTILFTLTKDNALQIEYTATTDQPTPVNLTNHSYFNLSAGRDSTQYHQTLYINADRYTEVNKELIPTGRLPAVKGTAMDFTKAKPIGINLPDVPGGYDHNYVLNKSSPALGLAAIAYDSVSGREMDMLTTEPGVQFYTGNFLDGSLEGKGHRYNKHAAFCLEAQHFPDSPNQPGFPSTILKPGEAYHQLTIYKFSTK